MANKSKMTYIGVTSNLNRRVKEHKDKSIEGYTSKYNLTKLVYYETMTDVYQALKREKQLKNWHRQWKINLIEQVNKDWRDLAEEL
jgi:putative endonuclease